MKRKESNKLQKRDRDRDALDPKEEDPSRKQTTELLLEGGKHQSTDAYPQPKVTCWVDDSSKRGRKCAASQSSCFSFDNENKTPERVNEPPDIEDITSTYYVPETMNDEFLAEQALAVESFNNSIRANSFSESNNTSGRERTGDGFSHVPVQVDTGPRPGAFAIAGIRTSQRADSADLSSQVSPPRDVEAPHQEATDIVPVEAHLVEEAVPTPVYVAQPLPPRSVEFPSTSALDIQNVQMDMDSTRRSDAGDLSNASEPSSSNSTTKEASKRQRRWLTRAILFVFLASVSIAIAVIIGFAIGHEPPDSRGLLEDSSPCEQRSDCVSGACGLDSVAQDARFVCCPSGETAVWTIGQSQQSYCAQHLPPGSACPMSSSGISSNKELCRSGECQAGTCPSEEEETVDPSNDFQSGEPTTAPGSPPTELKPCTTLEECGETSTCSSIYGHPLDETFCCPEASTTGVKASEDDVGQSYCKHTIPLGGSCPSASEHSQFLCETSLCIAGSCVAERRQPGGICEKNDDCFTLNCDDGVCA